MPMPVSRTAKCRRCTPGPAGSASTWTITSPLCRELDRVREQVEQHLPEPSDVAHDSRRDALVDETAELDDVLRGARRDDRERLLDAFAEIERRSLQLEPARLDLREVEDVVDHAEQRVAARPDDLRELPLLRRQLRSEQQAGHPDDGVHRRADLVAHRRQECALGSRRRLRLLSCALELVEVARLVDRRRGERGEGVRRPRVFGGVEVGLEAVAREHADQPVADQQRNGHPALDHAFAEGIVELRKPCSDVRHDEGVVPLDQLAGGIVRPSPLVAQADHLIEVRVAVAADDLQLVAVDPLDAGALVGHDLAQLRQDQAGNLGDTECAAKRMCRGAERLGLLARGALGFEQARVLDRDRRLGRERRGELRELLVVDIRLELVDADDADDAVADDHRRADPAANSSGAVTLAGKVRVRRDVREDLCPS